VGWDRPTGLLNIVRKITDFSVIYSSFSRSALIIDATIRPEKIAKFSGMKSLSKERTGPPSAPMAKNT
jgi:hypothetical protein